MSTLFAQLILASSRALPKKVSGRSGATSAKTRRENTRIRWQDTFAQFNNRAGTSAIAQHLGRTSMSVHSSLTKMTEYGWVKRDGEIPHPYNGRDQIIWKWIPK